MVTLENYEEYMMLYADGELAPGAQQELMAFIDKHPELQQELSAYINTVSTPDATQVYRDKESLLRQPHKHIIALNKWVAYGAVAAILIIIFISIAHWEKQSDTATMTPIATKEQPRQQHVTAAPHPIAPQPAAITYVKKEKNLIPAVTKKQFRRSIITGPKPNADITAANENGTIAKLNMKKVNTAIALQTTVPTITPLPAQQVIPEIAVADNEKKTNTNILASLPIDDNKKQALETLKNAVTTKIEQVKTIKNNLKETDLVVKLGHKEFYLNL